MKFYKIMAILTLFYGTETWVLTKRHRSSIQTSEMKFLRAVKGCTQLDRIKNADIRAELNVEDLNGIIHRYRTRWREHVDRMPEQRIPHQVQKYKPYRRRSLERPRKRWVEQ